jgi:ATP-dependent Lhr-like helicase
VGELDEEMVYEARAGQVFLLGASSWRIEEIGRDRVIVTPAPGVPGAVPFWKGDSVGRPKELGEAIGAFSRWAVEQPAEVLEREYDLDARAAQNLLDFLTEQLDATRVLPSDRTIVLERFRDEIGDWRLCVLSPYGARIHAAWGLALAARIREELDLEADAISSDDGIILHLPDAEELDGRRLLELVLIEPEELEDRVVAELSGSALFGARFRENAARALLIPRAYPGKRTPLWQQRLKAQSLLEVAKRYGDFPIVLETYRECLRDVLDLPGLEDLLGRLRRRELTLIEVETPSASPFASSLLFDYVATYMYEGDTPNAERRAAALSLDRDLLRELLGSEELRELIDPGALALVEDDLQHRSPRARGVRGDELHDILRRIGDLTLAEAGERILGEEGALPLLEALERERRVARVRIAGEERFIDAADAGLYRDALGVVPPGGLPEAFLAEVPDALLALLRRYAATHGPFTPEEPRARWGIGAAPLAAALAELERRGTLVRGEIRPLARERDAEARGAQRELCDVEVLRRLRRASLAALRKEIEPTDRRALAAFLPSWHGIDRRRGPAAVAPRGSRVAGRPGAAASAAAGVERLREVLVPLQALPLTPGTWEREVLPRRLGAYSPAWIDELCTSGELLWIGAGALGRGDGRVALYLREDLPLLGPPPRRDSPGPPPAAEPHALLRAALGRGPSFFVDLLAAIDLPPEELREALWDLVWAGEVTNDAFAPLRAPRLTLARGEGARGGSRGQGGPAGQARPPGPGRLVGRSRFAPRRGRPQAQVQGRWLLTAPLFREAPPDPSVSRRALAELLRERHGILTRELVLSEGHPGGFAALYPELGRLETLGIARRGYFVEGLGGAQFALPGAVERLRSQRPPEETPPLVLAASDPAQPYGAALPWPEPPVRAEGSGRSGRPAQADVGDGRESRAGSRRPTRAPGANVVLVGAEPVLYLEPRGRGLRVLVGSDDSRVPVALAALAEEVRSGKLGRIALERIDGEPVLGSPWEAALAEVGFHAGPRRLTLGA